MDTKRFFYGGPRKSKNFKEIMEIWDRLIPGKEIEIKEYNTEFPEFHKNTPKYSFFLLIIKEEEIIESLDNKLIKKENGELAWQDKNGNEIPKLSVVAWEKMIAERQIYRQQAKENEKFQNTKNRINRIFNNPENKSDW